MIEKESLNFLTRFYSHLSLLEKRLKKYSLLNLELAEVKTEFFGETT